MVKSAFQGTLNPAADDDAYEIGIAVDAVDRGIRIEINDGNILDNDLPCLGVITAMDEEALVFVPEIVAEYALYFVAFLFNDQLGQIVVV
jgi:hypothetical protein